MSPRPPKTAKPKPVVPTSAATTVLPPIGGVTSDSAALELAALEIAPEVAVEAEAPPAPARIAGVLIPVGFAFFRCRACGFGWAENRAAPCPCPSCGPGYRVPAGHPAEG